MTTSTKSGAVAVPATQPDAPAITDALVLTLREHLAARRISEGIRLLEQHAPLFDTLDPRQANAARLVGTLAEWVDVGFDSPARLQAALLRFPNEARCTLPITDYVRLKLAEATLAMLDESTDTAIRGFDFVISTCEEIGDRETLAIAHFCKARCLRKDGRYDEALLHCVRGRELALELGHPAMASLMRVLESWLSFQQGKSKEANTMLQQAYEGLKHTSDHVSLGNIHSARGRIARRGARYEQAIEDFAQAIEEYKQRDPHHRNLARSLANMGLVERFIALQLRRRIDTEVQRRRKAVAKGKAAGASSTSYRDRMEQLRQEAFAHLDEAAQIYAHHPNHHGAGTVHVNRGYLHLDNGDFDLAESEAEQARTLGEQKRDIILSARARLLGCMIENARVEEEIGENVDPSKHARRALDYAREAVDLAKNTQNRRLLAAAYVWQGLSHCNTFFDDCDSARHCHEQALQLLKRDHPGSILEDLQALKTKIARSGTVDPKLRAWSQGTLGDKTFQQITEEFAELIIPKIWEKEGRKVSRVAERLSISPKKVRRILNRTGRRKLD